MTAPENDDRRPDMVTNANELPAHLTFTAGATFQAALADDMDAAVRWLTTIDVADVYEMTACITLWADVYLAHVHGRTGFEPAAVTFAHVNPDGEVGEVSDADGGHPAEVVWAGRMLAARAAGDRDTWGALIAAVTGPDATGESWASHVFAALHTIAVSYRMQLGAET